MPNLPVTMAKPSSENLQPPSPSSNLQTNSKSSLPILQTHHIRNEMLPLLPAQSPSPSCAFPKAITPPPHHHQHQHQFCIKDPSLSLKSQFLASGVEMEIAVQSTDHGMARLCKGW
ncbi:hypothetical protein M758_8G031800 [Ceratodon purpureus]|nr:hypothetical protein M758_8G031800 [Ceratodon purpureus]